MERSNQINKRLLRYFLINITHVFTSLKQIFILSIFTKNENFDFLAIFYPKRLTTCTSYAIIDDFELSGVIIAEGLVLEMTATCGYNTSILQSYKTHRHTHWHTAIIRKRESQYNHQRPIHHKQSTIQFLYCVWMHSKHIGTGQAHTIQRWGIFNE